MKGRRAILPICLDFDGTWTGVFRSRRFGYHLLVACYLQPLVPTAARSEIRATTTGELQPVQRLFLLLFQLGHLVEI